MAKIQGTGSAKTASNDAANDESAYTQTPSLKIITLSPAFMHAAANDETPIDVQKIKPQAALEENPEELNTPQDSQPEKKQGLFSGMLSSFSEKRETKADQKNRIAFAAYLNADSTDEKDIKAWVKKNFSRGTVADFKGDQSLIVSQKEVLKHLEGGLLSGLSKKQHKELTEARKEHIKDEANKFFEEHGQTDASDAPFKKLGRVSYVSSNWKEAPLKSTFGVFANIGLATINAVPASVDLLRERSHSKNEIKLEQAERLLSIAFRDADNTSKSGIRSWLEKNEKNGNLDLYKGDDKQLVASVNDVMKQFKTMSRDQKDTLIDAGNKHEKRDIVKATNMAYDSCGLS